MKRTILTTFLAAGLLLAACAPAAVTDTVPATVDSAMSADKQPTSGSVNTPVAVASADTASHEVSFINDIWPVIEKYALSAHGGKGGVFLENYNDIMKYVVPGSPEQSELYKRLTADGVSIMPPSGPLPNETIQLFYDWIAQGAKDN